jgi:glucose dehydrogenase
MSYRVDFEDGSARQYVLIAAGGHAGAGSRLGDHLVAFALEASAASPSE